MPSDSGGSPLAYRSGLLPSRFVRLCASALLVASPLLCPTSAAAQDAAGQQPTGEHHHPAIVEAGRTWRWTADANAFAGYNDQERHFAGFTSWESQNWIMGSGERSLGPGRLHLETMLSLEPFTVPATGSPQLFQTGESYIVKTGESYNRTPFVNLQHPHDLFMGLGATYRVSAAHLQFAGGADLVGAATVGPTPFMHRESARDNPQVPLTHHFMDSTHISTGVVRGGVSKGAMTLEASAFRGAEPDENRTNIERPGIDSWAARARYDSGSWHAQVSAAHLKQPEWFEPYDQTRITSSIGFEGTVAARPLMVTAAWGETREFNGFNGNADGYLLEWDLRAARHSTLYGRAEVADKELFGLGLHPKGFSHRHVFYMVGALSTGYVFDVIASRWGRIGVGADATLYHMPTDLLQYYGGSRSYHLFLRWRPLAQPQHMH